MVGLLKDAVQPALRIALGCNRPECEGRDWPTPRSYLCALRFTASEPGNSEVPAEPLTSAATSSSRVFNDTWIWKQALVHRQTKVLYVLFPSTKHRRKTIWLEH